MSRLAKEAGAGRWLAFRAEEPLPPDATISVTVGAGTPSAEGPLTTPAAQSFTFRTYGPLRVTRSYCAWGNECPPMTPWYVEFSNPLDEAAFDPAQVRIEPELPGAQIQVYGNTLNIQGRSAGRTTYTVRLAGDIGDIYGQTLGSDQVLTFKVGAAQPNLWAPGDTLVTLDPSAKKPAFSVFTINYDRLKVRAYAVQPGDWPAFKSYLRDYYRTDRPPEPPGRQVLSETVRVESRPDEMVETAIDLAPALQDGLGHVVLIVEPVTSLADQAGPSADHPEVGAGDPDRPGRLRGRREHDRLGQRADRRRAAAGRQARPAAGRPDRVRGRDRRGDAAPALRPRRDAADRLAGKRYGHPARRSLLLGRGRLDAAARDRQPALVRLRRPRHVPPRRRGPRQGLDPARGRRPDGRHRPAGRRGRRGVSYRLRDSQGNEVAQGNADLTGLGGFDLAFTLAENMNWEPPIWS